MKFITPNVHGFLDLLGVVFLLLSPGIWGFAGLLATFTYCLAGLHLLLTLLTQFNVGLIKLIPFPVHAAIEFLFAIILLILAYTLFNHEVKGKLFYIIFGTVVLLTWLFTDYRKAVSSS
jgi:hypothetical protein